MWLLIVIFIVWLYIGYSFRKLGGYVSFLFWYSFDGILLWIMLKGFIFYLLISC